MPETPIHKHHHPLLGKTKSGFTLRRVPRPFANRKSEIVIRRCLRHPLIPNSRNNPTNRISVETFPFPLIRDMTLRLDWQKISAILQPLMDTDREHRFTIDEPERSFSNNYELDMIFKEGHS